MLGYCYTEECRSSVLLFSLAANSINVVRHLEGSATAPEYKRQESVFKVTVTKRGPLPERDGSH